MYQANTLWKTLLLFLLIASMLTLAACQPEKNPPQETESDSVSETESKTETESETESETQPLTPDSATIAGTPLASYSIVNTTFFDALGTKLQAIIKDYCGHELPIVSESEADGKPFLQIGTSETPDFYEYRISTENGAILFAGYDQYAYANAFLTFVDLLTEHENEVLDESALEYTYELPDRAAYLEDPSLLYMRWAANWETPTWMLDYEYKKESLFSGNPTSDLFIESHRADFRHYPENSMEAIISCYNMGVTAVELDIHATFDGVLVLSHDASLTRMTNVKEFLGTPGYPSSASISAWTYEQLQDLRLKEGQGGDGAALTDFRIATLEEALRFCKGRMFIIPDKADNWEYIWTKTRNPSVRYLFYDMAKAENYESILISYGVGSADDALALQNQIKTLTGETPLIMLRSSSSTCQGYRDTLQESAAGSYLMQFGGNYNPGSNYERLSENYTSPIAAWTIGTGDGFNDHAPVWEEMMGRGIRFILTNDPLGMARYAAEIHKE